MVKINPTNTTAEVIPRRLESGPLLNVSNGDVTVSGGGEHVEVIAANAPVEVNTTILRTDTAIQVGVRQVHVEASPVGLRGEQGPPGPPGSGGSVASFLPPPYRLDEASDFFYYGWRELDATPGAYLIRRANRLTALKEDSTGDTANFDAAWDDRVNLGYVPR